MISPVQYATLSTRPVPSLSPQQLAGLFQILQVDRAAAVALGEAEGQAAVLHDRADPADALRLLGEVGDAFGIGL